MSGPYSSFPEGSNYEILASELNEEETKNVEVALKKKEDEINTKIATYKASFIWNAVLMSLTVK